MKIVPIKLITLISAAAFLLTAAEVKTDYDHQTDFGKYKTYTVLGVKATDTIWEDRITRALDSELSAKGWLKMPAGGAVSVTAFGSTSNQQTLETFYDGLGGGWGWRRGFGSPIEASTVVENTPVGTLTVDMFDAESKKLIWRGSGSDALSSKVEKNEKKLESVVADMFKKFPPAQKD